MVLGYMAMCSEVDHHVGRILDRLEQRGLADNTIVVYTSDHGETFGAYSSNAHKGTPEDVSVRVPLIIRVPDGTNAGWRSQLLVGALDLMPTLLGLIGITVPVECQGQDLSAAIRGRDDDAVESTPLFWFDVTPWRGVYTRRWTYSFENIDRRPSALPDDGLWPLGDIPRRILLRRFDTLYDREQDPHQLYNLYGHADGWGFQGITAAQRELHALTIDWLGRFEDPFPNQTELTARTAGRDGRPIDHLRVGN
jgi:arylsulfatase A-like enzyme